ncbi:MAG: PLP-dependent cysteine synthase family protein [Armatimonadetes bacterium]|nr:PLP-dependent cysteine synthase family protein [Armatimonadota bacterium]NOG92937.1 PLP-dependent cysteine synthase family protein [Armatimonadota bacterium]
MRGVCGSILEAIGGTPMVQLRSLVRPGMARVLVKIEGANPTGSKKDRMALEVIQSARRDGRLAPGQPVVEYTGGSTGTSLALVCAALGHPIFLVTSDAFSQEKRDQMAAFGAEIEIVSCPDGKITADLFRAMIARASEIAEERGAYWTDQLNNRDATRGYHSLGEEIWEQSDCQVDAYVESVGTAHGILGVAAALRRKRPEIEVVAVEPAESPVISEGRTGGHRIEGIGLGFLPPAWDGSVVDRVESVASADAHDMARRLAAIEGILAGASSGANVAAALRVAERLGEGRTVVTTATDSGFKYVSTEVYRRAPEDSGGL